MTDFVVGQVYELRKPANLWKGRLLSRELADIEGVLSAGTTVAIRKVQVDRSPEMGTVTDVFAEVLSGELQGKTVNVTWISQLPNSGYTKRDPTMLEPVRGQ